MAQGVEAGPAGGILIVGTGALAVLFAARLARHGLRVEMLGSWQEGLQALNRDGARLAGQKAFPVRAFARAGECSPARLALFLVKSWQTERAARALTECLLPDGLALSLQNGLGNRECLEQVLGPERAACGVTTLGATLSAPGVVEPGGQGPVVVERSARLLAWVRLLRSAGFQVEQVENPDELLWGKLVVSAAINPLAALLHLRNGELLERESARRLMGELAREAAAVAHASGIHLPYPDPGAAVERVARDTAANRASMLQDVLRGGPTEVEAINGEIVRRGRACGVPTPANQVVLELLRAL